MGAQLGVVGPLFLKIVEDSNPILYSNIQQMCEPTLEGSHNAIMTGCTSLHETIDGDRLIEPVGESSNHFGEPDRARRKDWLKLFSEKWDVGDGMGLSTSND
ncbi:hypothetical protein H5410_052412 [Solanum commersonii]|uniref:Uncharacterized protein n=1 Tax=Solanum commersonii TaxID=4109 RepID=A0A9J5X0S2_SOLCO|nr:hypothetical protein H5410_052412 [Solanum commersonii]